MATGGKAMKSDFLLPALLGGWLAVAMTLPAEEATPPAFPADPKLVNLTPEAIAQGERGKLGTDPALLLKGKDVWRNAGWDEYEKRVHRPPVNEAYPSWFILVWPDKQNLSGLRLRSNTDIFKLYAFRGGGKSNPAVAPASAWERIPFKEVRKAQGQERDETVREIEFAPSVETRALKLLILEVRPREAQIVWISEFSVWGEATSSPASALSEIPPFKVPCQIPVDGDAALVIDTVAGRRVRNLFAQVERNAGPAAEPWDLKDEDGQYVEPGVYQWNLIAGPTPELRYEFTPYPNVEAHSPESRPWDGRPQDGWLANHGNQSAVCVVGKRLYIAAGGTEGGHALIECDFQGRKVWGSPQGAARLFTDGKVLFLESGGSIFRFDPEKREPQPLFRLHTDPQRKGEVVGVAARDDKVFVAYYSSLPYLDHATTEGNVDIAACGPQVRPSVKRSDNYGIPLSPQRDFLSYFRLLGGFIGGDSRNTLYIESTKGKAARQHVLLAFRQPVPLGSLVFPKPDDPNLEFHLSILKPDAPYPPQAKRQADWAEISVGDLGPWNCVPAPEASMTRALRLTFARRDADPLEAQEESDDAAATGEVKSEAEESEEEALDAPAKEWAGRIEGMRLLRMRFKNLMPEARVRVSSGVYDAKTGEWDAQRADPLSPDDPAVFLMEWEQPQSVRGLAIKEIDGEWTEIDAYTGPEGGLPLNARDGWETVGSYRQPRRNHYQPDASNNVYALYLDGVVDFGREVRTRAIRLRVVKQWGEQSGRPEGVRADRGGYSVDPRRCRIYGVAALHYLGGEQPVEPIVTQRLSVFDAFTGKLLSERPSPIQGPMAFRPTDAALFAVLGNKVVMVDEATMQTADFITDLKQPRAALAFDPSGRLFVYDHDDARRNVRVYDASGKFLHAVGTPGRRKAGPYDPAALEEVCSMDADDEGNLWLVYPHENPRRVAHFKADGAFVQEFLGNTHYGGGGLLDSYDKTRFYWKDLVFHLDWETGKTRLDSLLSMNYFEASPWSGWAFRGDLEPIVAGGRRYLVSAPLVLGAHQPMAAVYLYDESSKTMRLAAAMGGAGSFQYLQKPEFLKTLGGKPLGLFRFIWADRNGDGQAQVGEVTFTPLDKKNDGRVGRFDSTLGAWAGSFRYEVKEFLPDGTPLFEARPMPFWADYRLPNGNHFRYAHPGGSSDPDLNEVVSPTGETLWSYKAKYGMDGLKIYPWSPGKADLQFGISGMARVEGDLGDIFVIHSNNGQMNLWTADGLLAGHLTFHMLDPRAKWWPAEHGRGAKLVNLTLGQEHFHHYFCKTADGRFYIVAGHNHASIIEVTGLEKFRRGSGKLEVTKEILDRTREWETEHRRREVFARAPVLEAVPMTPRVDGDVHDDEWRSPAQLGDFASFGMGYDERFLYLFWKVNGRGPLANHGDDFRRIFKTGAAVDVQLGANSKADPDRRQPVEGDLRLLITVSKGKPMAVLYRPICPAAPQDQRWETSTPAGGAASFDQVVTMPSTRIAAKNWSEGYSVEAAIPHKDFGLIISNGLLLKLDWGVLTTDEGHITRTRQYWANPMATGVSDEPTEARLEPHLWGHVRFTDSHAAAESAPHEGESEGEVEDLLEKPEEQK